MDRVALLHTLQGSDNTFPLALCCEARQVDVVHELLKHPRINVALEKARAIVLLMLQFVSEGILRYTCCCFHALKGLACQE